MDAPEPPDPKETAAAQQALNRDTAQTQFQFGATNQSGPWGNLTYNQIGNWEDGTPRYEANTTLSPANQNLFDQYTGLAGKLGGIGNQLATNVESSHSQPFKLGNEATEARLFELGSKRLDPMFREREQSTETDLLNRGIRPGTPAYESIKRTESEGRNDAYNSLLLQGRGQASNELSTERNQTMNELMAMLSGTQVQSPQFQNTPQPQVAGTDYAGLVQNNYQQQSQNQNAMMGGLGSIAGTLAGGWARGGFPVPSDPRLKENAEIVGKLKNGLNVWSFNYRGSKIPQIGLMADEVRKVRPEAVVSIKGFDHVRYDLAVI